MDDAFPNVGQIVTYTIALTNFGPNQATGLVVTDVLPPEVTFISATTLAGAYNPGSGVWTVGTLNQSQTVYLTIRAQATAPNPSVNVATITAQNEYDPNTGNNSSSAVVNPQLSDLSIVKSVDDPTPTANQIITFTVTVTNNGPNAATNVVASELLPAGLQYVSAIVTQGTYNSATNTWAVGNVGGGVSHTLTLQVRVIDMCRVGTSPLSARIDTIRIRATTSLMFW